MINLVTCKYIVMLWEMNLGKYVWGSATITKEYRVRVLIATNNNTY